MNQTAEVTSITAHNDIQQMDDLLIKQRAAFRQNPYPAMSERLNNLDKLKSLVLDNQQAIEQAMNEDFGSRASDDSKVGDIMTSVMGINYTKSKLKSWMKSEKRHVGIAFQPASAKVEYQPLGVIGIMVPWNYPLFLALGPLTAALAAGNRALIKMSEYTPSTNKLLTQLCKNYFPDDLVAVVEGDARAAAHFSGMKFDHLFFTGSTNVGKLVMRAASANLVPVTLELGGKSPAIICDDIDIKTAVNRFILGKTLNSGQTCVAPDYILCPRGKREEVVQALKQQYSRMFPTVLNNDDCTCVINEGQYNRLQGLLEDAKTKGATIIPLGEDNSSPAQRQMPLTLVLDATTDMTVLQDEIFGPILPILEYDSLDAAINSINDGERPLALYIYSFDEKTQNYITKHTHSGGVCINEAAFHVAVDDLPFGGVGASGMGNYHGAEGFKTFSHAKSILKRGKLTVAHFLFPPYGQAIQKLIYKLFIR